MREHIFAPILPLSNDPMWRHNFSGHTTRVSIWNRDKHISQKPATLPHRFRYTGNRETKETPATIRGRFHFTNAGRLS
jgi:hypothetical protein